MTSTTNPIRLMIITDMIAGLDAACDYLIGRCEDGDNDEIDSVGHMADAIAAAAEFLYAIKYSSQS
jgi:hypothetical protein